MGCHTLGGNTYKIQTRSTQTVISLFIIEKPAYKGFLKVIGVQNQLLITFCSQGLKLDPHTHEFLTFDILLQIKFEQKMIQKYIFNIILYYYAFT